LRGEKNGRAKIACLPFIFENAPGIFHADGPASLLFKDFDSLARNVTWDLYCTLGAQIRPQRLDRVEDLFGNEKAATEADDAGADAPIPLA